MNDYNSILKEEKKYDEEIPSQKGHGKLFFLDFLLVIILLGISYLFYNKLILTSQNIFKNDIYHFYDMAKFILEPLHFDFNNNNYGFNGKVAFNEYEYQFDIVRDKKDFKISLDRDSNRLIYFLENNVSYTKVGNNDYVAKEKDNILNSFFNIRDNFDRVISDDNYIRRFYLDGYNPVVEVNLVLNSKNINDILDSSIITDNVEVTFTFKNDAIMNKLMNSKIVIVNKTTNKRITVVYHDNVFTVTDSDGSVVDYEFDKKEKDFTIKVMKNHQLYSIINGMKKDSDYQYSYQVIDSPYNLMLNVISNDHNLKYEFSSHIGHNNDDMVEKKLLIDGSYIEDGALSKDKFNSASYSSFNKADKDKFDTSVDTFFLPIREFIDEYKNGVN